MTELDLAHQAMDAAPDDDAARLRFYESLADCELFLLLAKDANGDDISPEVFDVDGDRFVLIFDREDRLVQFVGKAAPFAAMSGRALAGMLAGQSMGLALNPDVAPSSMLMPAAAVDWLAATLAAAPQVDLGRPVEVRAPRGVPEAVVLALDRKLAIAGGIASYVFLAGVSYDSGQQGHVVAVIDALPGAEPAIAAAVNEALVFSGVEAGSLDVLFMAASDPVAAQLARVGLRFDLPPKQANSGPQSPGMDPDRPPRLR